MQPKVFKVGGRSYKVETVDPVDATVQEIEFEFIQENVMVINNSGQSVDIWFNAVTNDRVTIPTGTTMEFPLKVMRFFVTKTGADDGAVTVIGFRE